MLDNYDLKQSKLDEVIEVFTEFSDLDDGEFSSKELFLAANNFLEIARGKSVKKRLMIDKAILILCAGHLHVMTKSWKTYYEYYSSNQLHDHCCLDWNEGFNKFNQINMGWN